MLNDKLECFRLKQSHAKPSINRTCYGRPIPSEGVGALGNNTIWTLPLRKCHWIYNGYIQRHVKKPREIASKSQKYMR